MLKCAKFRKIPGLRPWTPNCLCSATMCLPRRRCSVTSFSKTFHIIPPPPPPSPPPPPHTTHTHVSTLCAWSHHMMTYYEYHLSFYYQNCLFLSKKYDFMNICTIPWNGDKIKCTQHNENILFAYHVPSSHHSGTCVLPLNIPYYFLAGDVNS